MTTHRIALVAGAALLALGLTACGGGAGVSFGSDGVEVTDGQGGRVSAGTDGVSASDGQGNRVTAGSDGSVVAEGSDGSVSVDGSDGSVSVDGSDGSVSVDGTDGSVSVDGTDGSVSVDGTDGSVSVDGADGSVVADGSDGSDVSDVSGDSQSGVTGQLTLAGARTYRGTVSGICVADGSDRSLDVTVGSTHELRLDLSGGDLSIAFGELGQEWGAEYSDGRAAKLVSVAGGRTAVHGARLVSADGSVVTVDAQFAC